MTLRLALAATLAALALPANAVGHRADLSIVDRSTGRELPVSWHDGRAYVAGHPGNEYQVTVRNRQGGELLAVVSVDGLNVVNGKAAHPSQSGYVLRSWDRLDIRGWRKSMEETAAFYFTSLPDSYASRTGRPDEVGVIGVALFERARPRHDTAPAEVAAPEARREKSTRDSAGAAAPQAAAPLGTGHGRREDSRATYADFERASRDPVETITLYYDSHRNLVAQGVIPTYGRRRDPRPFASGFTPDP